MVVTRDLDNEFVNLQRQGELALYASCRGQEAAQIGAAAYAKTRWRTHLLTADPAGG
jgi:pyruvate dehydrogenase E1 component alpha subunit